MRKISPYLLICIIFLSCKKEEVIVISPSALPTSIQLKIAQVITDSTITLSWSKYTGENFQKYRLVRIATYLKNGQFTNFDEPVDSSRDINHVSFTENNMPLSRDIRYYLFISKDTTQFNGGMQFVAQVLYQRPNSLVYGLPTDVLFNASQKNLYIIEPNKITLVNYTTGRPVLSKEFTVGIGYCSLGDFNGSTEIYVPLSDGWLQILDAATLQMKDRIYVAGYEIGSVVAANEKLYVSSSDMTVGGLYSNCIKIYDRATKNVLGRTGYWDRTRLLQLEGTSVEMIDLTIHLMPIDLSYYQFSSNGVLLSKMQDAYHGDYMMDANIARSFPGGSKFITSSSGTIFNKSLVFDRYIKQNGNYADFAFNSNGSIIYAGNADQKRIDAITYPALTATGTYPTVLYPYKIFRDGNTIICVSRAIVYYQQATYLLIEKINL